MSLLMKIVPLLSSLDRLMSMLPGNGKKTELMLAVKVGLLPLLASVLPGFQPAMAGLALDTAVELMIALFGAHKLVKLMIVRAKAVMQ